jgi:hypothetical protein
VLEIEMVQVFGLARGNWGDLTFMEGWLISKQHESIVALLAQ